MSSTKNENWPLPRPTITTFQNNRDKIQRAGKTHALVMYQEAGIRMALDFNNN
jgi:hypothetical protein